MVRLPAAQPHASRRRTSYRARRRIANDCSRHRQRLARTGAIRTPVAILTDMRGGGAQVTTDLLSEWTDPDTAMEAVGNSLGVFDHATSATAQMHGESPLRAALYTVLLRLVDGGALETR